MMSYSKYASRMRNLCCKIFAEYRRPPMPKELLKINLRDCQERNRWKRKQKFNEETVRTYSKQPCDLNVNINANYFPPHPQIRSLVHVLREYGLFRDEHVDFKEEMKRIAISRGKVMRKVGGSGGKRAALKNK